MKRKIEYIAVVVMVIILFIIPGCSGDIIQPIPPDPEVFADITGYDSLHFESLIMTTFNGRQLNFGGSSKISGKQYGLAISIFYLDTVKKTGTFSFMSTPDSNKVYAVGSFTIGNGIDEKIFMSDSGTVIISEINGMAINGTFNFYGSLKDGSGNVIVKNGILKTK